MRNIRLYILTIIVILISFLQISVVNAAAPSGFSMPDSDGSDIFIFEDSLLENPEYYQAFENILSEQSPQYVYSFQLGASAKYWNKVAVCETASNWQNPGQWGGGLGIYNVGEWQSDTMGTWERWGGEQFALRPQYASKFQQMIVANRIAVHGYKTLIKRDPAEAKRKGISIEYIYDKEPAGFVGWGCIKSKSTGQWRVGLPKENLDFKVSLPLDSQFYCPQYEPLFYKYGLPVKLFSNIAWKTSRCNPNFKSASGSSGLLAITPRHQELINPIFYFNSDSYYIPEYNVIAASWIVLNSPHRINNWGYQFNYSTSN